MPHRKRVREYLVTDRDGAVCGIVRIACDGEGRFMFEWEPGEPLPKTQIHIPETMRASQFLAAWLAYEPDEGLELTG